MTYEMPTYQYPQPPPPPKQPFYKKWWFWLLIVLGIPVFFIGASFFILIVGLLVDDGDATARPVTAETTVTAEPSPVETVEPTIEPTPEPADPTTIPVEEPSEEPEPEPTEEERFDIYQTETTTFVAFDIQDSFTNNGIRRGAQDDTLAALQAAITKYPEYDRVTVMGSFLMVDKYGNEDMSQILNAAYDRATVEKINFDNINPDNILELRDAGMVHPNLLK